MDDEVEQLTARLDILSPTQIDHVEVILDAYKSFWDHVRFKRGWETPFFTRREVLPLLQKAAEFVYRIRELFDSLQEGIKLRAVEGNAKEYLWTLTQKKIKPTEIPDQFVKELIHETLKDANGYHYNLNTEKVDNFIEIIQKFLSSERTLWSDLEDTRTPEEVVGVVKRYKVFSTRDFEGDTKLIEYSGIDCTGAPILACFSSVGLLSVIVGNSLVKSFKLPLIGHIQAPAFPVSTTIQAEQPMWPVRFYGNKDLVVFIGGFEVPEEYYRPLVKATLDFATRHKSPMVYTTEGIAIKKPTEEHEEELAFIDDSHITKLVLRAEAKASQDSSKSGSPSETPKVEKVIEKNNRKEKKETEETMSIDEIATQRYGKLIHYVTTDVPLAKKLHGLGHVPCVEALLSGFTAELLATAAFSPVDITAILSPTSVTFPDFQAAIKPMRLINSLLPTQADTTHVIKSLYKDGAKLQRAIQEDEQEQLASGSSRKNDLRSSGQIGMYG